MNSEPSSTPLSVSAQGQTSDGAGVGGVVVGGEPKAFVEEIFAPAAATERQVPGLYRACPPTDLSALDPAFGVVPQLVTRRPRRRKQRWRQRRRRRGNCGGGKREHPVAWRCLARRRLRRHRRRCPAPLRNQPRPQLCQWRLRLRREWLAAIQMRHAAFIVSKKTLPRPGAEP